MRLFYKSSHLSTCKMTRSISLPDSALNLHLNKAVQHTNAGSASVASEPYPPLTASAHISGPPSCFPVKILKFETQLCIVHEESALCQKQIKGTFLIPWNPLKHTRMSARRNKYTDRRPSGADRKDTLKRKNVHWISTAVENPNSFSE